MNQSQPAPLQNNATPLRVGAMALSLLVGFVAALLLPITPWGINVPIFIAVLIAAIAYLVFRYRVPLSGGGRWLVLPIFLFAALFALRDSAALGTADFLALVLCLGIAALRTQQGQLRVA